MLWLDMREEMGSNWGSKSYTHRSSYNPVFGSILHGPWLTLSLKPDNNKKNQYSNKQTSN